ncbi:MAG: hypothetical protein HQL31_05045 [Planctomycetes bacterium]|nr:hypothetical protein [Planctomycetota bacterium]
MDQQNGTPPEARVMRINNQQLGLFYPEEDFSYTWKEHGGLTGHISMADRNRLRKEREQEDLVKLDQIVKGASENSTFQQFSEILQLLGDYFGCEGARLPGRLDYHLLSGFSRCGGTYLLSECGRMHGIDVRKRHIVLYHDFGPSELRNVAMDYRARLMDFHLYFGTFIADSLIHSNTHHFKRSILAPLMLPYMENLSLLLTDFRLEWWHTLRGMHGTYPSLLKMYEGSNIMTVLNEFYRPGYVLDTDFGNMTLYWFMANLSVLPCMRGLPFWDLTYNPGIGIRQLVDSIRVTLDRYIKRYSAMDAYPLGRPQIIKYGDQERFCNGKTVTPSIENYTAEAFHSKPVPEVDDRYTQLAEELTRELGRVYQAFGLPFDGVLPQT